MKYTKLHYQIALTQLKGVGPIKAKAILEYYPDLEEFFQISTSQINADFGLRASLIDSMRREDALHKSDELVNEMNRLSIKPLFINDISYPRRLKQLPDAPIILYAKGQGGLNFSKIVSVVGTRSNTNYGNSICHELVESFVGQDILVVSGLALGIDASIHKNCVKMDVPTVAVLGHGLDRVYPSSHRELANRILEKGALVTDFPTGTNPDRENFPKRNRIVAGMSDATIVVESKRRGGSLITAHLAADYNRDVYAFPGNVINETSQGSNDLIRSNRACLIQSPSDFLENMGWVTSEEVKQPQRNAFPELSAIQQLITSLISKRPKIHIDVISAEARLPITQLNKELFTLEMNGVVRSLPGKTYCIA